MDTGNALLLDGSIGTGTRTDDGTGLGIYWDTSADTVSVTDCYPGTGISREIGGKCTGLDSSCFGEAGLQVSQQSLIALRRKFNRAETQESKTTETKLTTHDNGKLVKFNQVTTSFQRNCISCLKLKNFQPWKLKKLARLCTAWFSSIIYSMYFQKITYDKLTQLKIKIYTNELARSEEVFFMLSLEAHERKIANIYESAFTGANK